MNLEEKPDQEWLGFLFCESASRSANCYHYGRGNLLVGVDWTMAQTLIIGDDGKLTLPLEIRTRYGFEPAKSVRIVETKSGLLIVPLTDEPMSESLQQELQEWQSLGLDSLQTFPYESEHGKALK